MTARFFDPQVQYRTNTLGTLPGAKLYFYENGTSTPKPVYTGANGSTAHAYPVVADSNGLFPPIYLLGTYRVELKDAGGTTQLGWPVDDVMAQTYTGTIDGDLEIIGNNRRILGNFSDATVQNRLIFQSSTTDGATVIGIVPNGVETNAWHYYYNDSDTSVSAPFRVGVDDTAAYVDAPNATGTSNDLPLILRSADSKIKLSPITGHILVGDATDQSGNKNALLQLEESSESGIYLGNTNNSASNVLDWYEEGVGTPTSYGTSTAGSGTYTRQSCKYTRTGNKVNFVIDLGWSAHTGTGSLAIAGLPFTVGSLGATASVLYNGLTVGSSKELTISINPSATTISLIASDPSGGAASNFSVDSAVTYLTISGFYFT